MFAWMSILLTLPEATTTVIIVLPRFEISERLWLPSEGLREVCVSLIESLRSSLLVQQGGGVNVDDFFEVENAKKQIGISRYILSIVLVAFTQASKNLSNGNVGFRSWAGLALGGELALALLAFACHRWTQRKWLRANAEIKRLCFIVHVCGLFGLFFTAPFPAHLHYFVTLLESIREIPWTWPLLWPHWPWPVPEIRWDMLAAAMHIFNHMAGVLVASVSYRRVVCGIKRKPFDPGSFLIQGIVYSVQDRYVIPGSFKPSKHLHFEPQHPRLHFYLCCGSWHLGQVQKQKKCVGRFFRQC